ncbi:MAG: thiamine biosynthesis protein ThiS [Anaerolineae bacterium]|nr:thiamine biosynthesis protein ThiS [Gloeobacterales cyanobacterium ES-bin-313]
MLEVRINGENRLFPAATMVLEMLMILKLEPKLLVIEYNGDILHRQDWEKTMLQPGDRFEIVTVVGGG